MLKTRITGEDAGFADVQDKSLLTSILPYPPLNVENKVIPFIGNLTVNGDGITTNLSVDGSVVSVDAFVGPPVNGDLYITTANILIADSGVISLNRFGNITSGLNNGIEFFVETASERIITSIPLKSNFDFIRIGTLTEGIGSKNDAYQLSNTDPDNDDGYNPVIDFTRISPLGIRLIKDTQDKIGLVINDDITSVSTFNVIITGFIRI
jgi:hypothetical protein